MDDAALNKTVDAFNQRRYAEAARQAGEGLATAQGPDEAFWIGLHEACEGYALLAQKQFPAAERKLVASLRTLRNFGYRYENFEVTAALAGIRRTVEEIRNVRARAGKVFDVSLLPQLRLAAKADD